MKAVFPKLLLSLLNYQALPKPLLSLLNYQALPKTPVELTLSSIISYSCYILTIKNAILVREFLWCNSNEGKSAKMLEISFCISKRKLVEGK